MVYMQVVSLCAVALVMTVGILFAAFRYDDVFEKFYRWCKKERG